MLFSSKIFLLLALVAAIPSNALTYWVDESCTERPNWRVYFQEAIDMANWAHRRLNSNSDTDFAAVYERIFKVAKSPVAFIALNRVNAIMGGIPAWRPSEGNDARRLSDLRFYCDEDERWTANPAGGWDDITNYMHRSAGITPDCLIQSKEIHGGTYQNRALVPPSGPNSKENPQRATVTICDFTFDYPIDYPDAKGSLSEYGHNFDFSQLADITHLEQLISLTILHEWTHVPAYNTIDVGDREDAYTWPNVVNKNADQSLQNADNYAYFGLWAALAQRDFTLPRLGVPKDPKADADAQAGKIVKYRDITHRSLQTKGRHFQA